MPGTFSAFPYTFMIPDDRAWNWQRLLSVAEVRIPGCHDSRNVAPTSTSLSYRGLGWSTSACELNSLTSSIHSRYQPAWVEKLTGIKLDNLSSFDI